MCCAPLSPVSPVIYSVVLCVCLFCSQLRCAWGPAKAWLPHLFFLENSVEQAFLSKEKVKIAWTGLHKYTVLGKVFAQH